MSEFDVLKSFVDREPTIFPIKCPNGCEHAFLQEVVTEATVIYTVSSLNLEDKGTNVGDSPEVYPTSGHIFHRRGICEHNFGNLSAGEILQLHVKE